MKAAHLSLGVCDLHEAILRQGCEKQPDGRICVTLVLIRSPSGHVDLAGVDEAREVVRETTSAIVIIRGRSKRDLEIHQHSATVRQLARG